MEWQTVWKYAIDIDGVGASTDFHIEMPAGSHILYAVPQGWTVAVYALVTPTAPKTDRAVIRFCKTGELYGGPLKDFRPLGVCHYLHGEYMLHVFTDHD